MHGQSIDHSAQSLEISHQCAFDMRHKFLPALMDFMADNQTKLGEVSELDETYVLESYKGSKFSDSAIRNPRKHGAPGISSEYICICTGIQRQGEPFAKTVNRAKPSTAEPKEEFDSHIDSGTLILCDGLREYHSLNLLTDCAVADVHSEEFTQQSFYNLNTVNRFHHFIKEQYRKYRVKIHLLGERPPAAPAPAAARRSGWGRWFGGGRARGLSRWKTPCLPVRRWWTIGRSGGGTS